MLVDVHLTGHLQQRIPDVQSWQGDFLIHSLSSSVLDQLLHNAPLIPELPYRTYAEVSLLSACASRVWRIEIGLWLPGIWQAGSLEWCASHVIDVHGPR